MVAECQKNFIFNYPLCFEKTVLNFLSVYGSMW